MNKIRPYILAETNWNSLQSESFDLAILPWGATEAHNYHLPYSTDILEADFIAAKSAKYAWEQGAKIIVLPTIPFGVIQVKKTYTWILILIQVHNWPFSMI